MFMKSLTNVQETMFINGKERAGNQTAKIYNPARKTECVGEITIGTIEDVNYAVDAAEKAWKSWKNTTPEDRAHYLNKTIQHVNENLDDLARLLVMEHGKTLNEAKGDLLGGVNVLRYYSSLVDEVKREKLIENEQGKWIMTRQPMGVVSIIVPWNYPIILAFLMLAPAIMAGNTVVIKPATYCPLTLTKILKYLGNLLPDGVLNVVPGSGSVVGDAMVRHPRVRKVSFTGSTEVGVSVIKNSADTIKNVSMELGGNDAAVILKDADINQRMIDEMIKGVFTAAGQICYNIKRIYVHRDHYKKFSEGFLEAASIIKVGNGLNKESTMGPINNKPQYESVKKIIEKLAETKADVYTVGEFIEEGNLSDGYYIMPTVVLNANQKDPIVQEEQFGPVIPIIPFESEDEVIELVNDTEFGLGNSVWTNDSEHGFEVARKLQSGSVFINIHRAGASGPNMPFGGFKQSGIGRGHGIGALHEQMELQTIILRTDM